MTNEIVALSEGSSNRAHKLTKPIADEVICVTNRLCLPWEKWTIANEIEDMQGKYDAINELKKLMSCHVRGMNTKKDGGESGTDLHQVLAQNVLKYEDLFDLKCIKRGRDFYRDFSWHVYRCGPWIHLFEFGIIKHFRDRCLEYLGRVKDDYDWTKKKWKHQLTPDNLPKEYKVKIGKFMDDREHHESKVSMFIPPLYETFKDKLMSCVLVDDEWRRWDGKNRRVL